MSSISNIRSNPSMDLLKRIASDSNRPAPKDKGALSSTTPHGLSIAPGNNGAEAAQASQGSKARARTAAEGLVSTTLIEPILKQIRESNTTPPPFGPSSAEKQFTSLLDSKLADEIVHASNFPLVERLTEQLLRNMPAESTPQQSLDTQG